MKGSFIIIGFFITGIFCGFAGILPSIFLNADAGLYALYLLMFLIGIGIGSDMKAFSIIKTMRAKIVLIPLATITGSLLGGVGIGLLLQEPLQETVAVSAGFGYYSLSSIYISKICGDAAGVMALMSNMCREILTLLLIPLLAKRWGPLAPIASGGATSMDTTLPLIIRHTGREYGVISIFHGTTLTVAVPLLIPVILS